MASSWMGRPSEIRGVKARPYFKVEQPGLVALHRARAGLLNLWSGLEQTLDGMHGATHGSAAADL